jgi:hypothetical protein
LPHIVRGGSIVVLHASGRLPVAASVARADWSRTSAAARQTDAWGPAPPGAAAGNVTAIERGDATQIAAAGYRSDQLYQGDIPMDVRDPEGPSR